MSQFKSNGQRQRLILILSGWYDYYDNPSTSFKLLIQVLLIEHKLRGKFLLLLNYVAFEFFAPKFFKYESTK